MQVDVMYYSASWCQPCKSVSKVMPYLEKNISGMGIVQKIDIDEQHELATQNNIRSVPTFVLLQDGVEKERIVGVIPMVQLEEKIKQLSLQGN